MARPKAATPAAHIRSVLRFFETANQELADVAFELVRAALAERKARKKPVEKPKTRVIVQSLAVPDAPPSVAPGAAAPPTGSPAAAVQPAATPTRQEYEARPANKKRLTGTKKKKPAAAAGKKPAARPTGSSTVIPETDALPEQHPIEEIEEAEPPTPIPTPM